jgi:hypothetical protein
MFIVLVPCDDGTVDDSALWGLEEDLLELLFTAKETWGLSPEDLRYYRLTSEPEKLNISAPYIKDK